MSKKEIIIMPKTKRILETMGNQIKLARLRRNLSMDLVCERAGITRTTLWQIEKGAPTVSIGAYASVLHALNGMDEDLLKVAEDDILGRNMQDHQLKISKRAKKVTL